MYCTQIYTVSQKNIPDIFDCNFKKNYQILIIFGVIIPDNTCHKKLFSFHLAQFLLLHYQGNADQVKYALKCAKT